MTYHHHMKALPQNYSHKEAEKRWQQHWVSSATYRWHDDRPRAQTYVIDTPPPTVSGLLHMGHVFSYTQCDFVARYQRMTGKDVFYPMGFDDNGLPTERLVEKTHKKRATDYESREKFVEVCDSVAEEARRDFRGLFQSIALSVDWEQEYHTISPEVQAISQASFIDLYQKGHVERRLQPFFWDPIDQTAIAQAEIEDKTLPSHHNIIPFGIVDAGTPAQDIKWGQIEKIKVMTTRPELLGACVALMCHPDDAARFAGKQAVTPLYGVVVPIIADEKVNKEKGTGFVMCCTFGDETDIAWWREHNLPMRVILNKYAKLELRDKDWLKPEKDRAFCSLVDEKWSVLHGLKVAQAREKTIEILREMNLLLEQEAITHTVKCAERSGAPLEILETPQWFVKITDKKDALKARAQECVWHPDWMRLRIEQWIDGLNSDWCISRQRYFGVPFPVWYSKRAGEEGKMLIADADQLPCNPLSALPKGYTRDEVEPDADVMDTWATSSISPQISAHAIHGDSARFASDGANATQEARFAKLFPADLRPQAHEIIRTWAFYTIVKAHLHGETIPWKNLMISGWCLAEDKTKMSKSKGNVVTPVELIEEQGTDAVRYWAATSRLGQDTAYSTELLKIGKKLVTKLWNATKFAAIHFEKLAQEPTTAAGDVQAGIITEALDLWLLTRLQRTVKKATAAFDAYEYCDALRATEDFFWNDFCDNYLELVKKRVYDEAGANPAAQQSAACTIFHALDAILRLFAPFVPHITEELFAHLFPARYEATGSLHARKPDQDAILWPDTATYPLDESAEASGIAAVSILNAIRKAKSERGVSIKVPVTAMVLAPVSDGISWELVAPVAEDLKAAGSVEALQWQAHAPEGSAQTDDARFAATFTFADAAAA